MSKRHQKNGSKNGGGESGPGWEIVYSGFILILLCFFIMLCSFSTMEEAKIMQFVRSFSNAVSFFPGGHQFESGAVILPKSSGMVASRSSLAKLFEDLEALSDRFDLEDEIELLFSKEGLVMRLAEHTLFESGVATISAQALPLLEKIGAIITQTDYLIRIEGHTDNVPIHTDAFPSNWELSTARAVNVLRYFIQHHRIDAKRMSAEGFGEFRPLVANDTEENRATNRRVVVIFIRPDLQNPAKEDRP
ncbi:MAG: flagellar motor protein MotB [Deltaproteobacteria bacterium]|jgi:chemotaxis protein MotB|nr:flagellar motor protein MotB [Deltaproteobacteria bacterium]